MPNILKYTPKSWMFYLLFIFLSGPASTHSMKKISALTPSGESIINQLGRLMDENQRREMGRGPIDRPPGWNRRNDDWRRDQGNHNGWDRGKHKGWDKWDDDWERDRGEHRGWNRGNDDWGKEQGKYKGLKKRHKHHKRHKRDHWREKGWKDRKGFGKGWSK